MAVSNKTTGARKLSQTTGGGAKRSAPKNKKTAARSTKEKRSASGKKTAAASNAAAGKKQGAARKKSLEEMNAYQDHLAFEMGITIFVILIVSVFLYLSYFGLAGRAGVVAGGLFFGIFGWFAWLFPLSCLIGFIFCLVNKGDKRIFRRLGSFGGMVLSLLGLSDLIFQRQIITEYYTSNHVMHRGYFECMYLTCTNVVSEGKFNGGLLGRAVGTVFSAVIGRVGACVILFALLLLFLYIFYGVEWMGILRKRNSYRREMEEIYEDVSQDASYEEPSYRVFSNPRLEHKKKAFQPRQMEKAPRVQSFDLRKINGEQQLSEEEKTSDKEKRSGSAAENVLAAEGERTKESKESHAVKGERTEKFTESLAVQGKADEGTEKEDRKVEASEEVTANREDTATKENPRDLDNIPIYRNELNEKFGKKRKAQKEVQEAEEEKKVSVLSMDELFEPESASDFLSEETDDRKAAAADLFGEEAEPFAVLDEPVEESMVSAPMPSFAHKEEVTDVTPLSQKRAEAAAAAKVENQTKPAVAAPAKPKAVPHGKIGGDDYVSASGTFNALNDSKVSAQSEKPYEFPPIDLLSLPENVQGSMSDEELRMTASKLQDTLKSFNVNVKMGAVTCGPTVTRYELLPEQGVRVNKITNLADDLKLSLAAASIRIEAPIPGKAAVGIEVPNPSSSPVYFRELLEGDTFHKAKSDLTFAVGKDIAGKLIMADIAKMPHLLIAGATGSGKSVCINTLIMSILYKADPKDVKLIMIDPKVVELSVYNGIPHLFCPVVTDPKEAAAALNWAVREMMDRYNKFKELGVRNIAGYNEKIKTVENAQAAGYDKMPYLVVIVDEFADLMMVASKEVEDAVCRLAQLARAAGIHLVLATQRPSVNVITGVIKANIPSRIAFSVSSVIDSRTILDKGGAEKLLGKGDMLFFPSGYSEPVRVQGAFVSDKEVSDVVDFLCSNNETPEYNHAVTEIVEEPKEEEAAERKTQPDRDEYFEDAGRFVIESDRAAAGQLQRRFSIGFNRAGRIIDQLNKAGVVGPAEGTKPRKVLMTIEEFEQMLSGGDVVSDEEMESMVREMEDELGTTQEDSSF